MTYAALERLLRYGDYFIILNSQEYGHLVASSEFNTIRYGY